MPKARAANLSTSLNLRNPIPMADPPKAKTGLGSLYAYRWKTNGPTHTTFLDRWKFTTVGKELKAGTVPGSLYVPRWSGVLLNCLTQAIVHRLPKEQPRTGIFTGGLDTRQ